MNWQLIITVIILLALAVAGIAVKMFFKKGATFQKHCVSKDAGKNDACVCQGNEEECQYRALHHPSV
jgi:flagellar basal body-associated protein FliL